MTGKTQMEAVRVLRDVLTGSFAEILISRQSTVNDDCSRGVESSTGIPYVSDLTSEHDSVLQKALVQTTATGLTKNTGINLVDLSKNSEMELPRGNSNLCQSKSENLNSPEACTNSSSRGDEPKRVVPERMSSERKLRLAKKLASDNRDVSRNDSFRYGDDAYADVESLTFNVALREAGAAGLGITVQRVSERGRDLGISIKSVIVGGAVSKVKPVYFVSSIFLFVSINGDLDIFVLIRVID